MIEKSRLDYATCTCLQKKTSLCVAFLSNTAVRSDITVTIHNLTYDLSAWSVSIYPLEECGIQYCKGEWVFLGCMKVD